MIHKPFFPRDITGQRAWLVNGKAQIAIVGASVGLTPAQITAAQNNMQLMIAEIDAADAMQIAAKAKNASRDLVIKTQMATLRPLIATIKNNPGYTATVGEQLNVIGTEVTFDATTAQTAVKLTGTPQGVDIKFSLEQCEAGNIYCMRGTETAFSFFKSVMHPHTIDTRPNLTTAGVETRQYYVTLILNDVEVGIPSLPVTINI